MTCIFENWRKSFENEGGIELNFASENSLTNCQRTNNVLTYERLSLKKEPFDLEIQGSF